MKARLLTKTSRSVKSLRNKFYIKYYMIKAGNDNPELKKEMDHILKELHKLLA